MSSTTTTPRTLHRKPKVVFLNAARLDYDQQLDWSRLRNLCDELTLGDRDTVTDEAELLRMVQQQDIVVAKEMPVPAHVLAQFPNTVRLICEAGTGYNNWPVALARKSRDLPVCNLPTYSTEAVAHMAVTYIMNFSVSMFRQQEMLRQGDRRNFTGPFTLPLRELNGSTVGLVGGAGRIGTRVAHVCLALGMKVYVSSRAGQFAPDHTLYGHPDVVCTSDVDEVLRVADYVSIHTPLNEQTRGSFGKAQIERMKPTAFLINTARGAVCAEDELVACLRDNVIAGAGLDVTATEPPAMDSPLWDLPNCWLSPHTGWRRLETRQRLVDMTADNIEAFVNANSPKDYINVVN